MRLEDKIRRAHTVIVKSQKSGYYRKLSHSFHRHDKRDHYFSREQPIFTTKAHVFQIDPDTKKNWIPASKESVGVSYYYDSARGTYRIISVDGSKAIINSTVTPSMTFTKTSQKFGQWSDPRANTVYGLGFATEADLTKFIEKFKEVKELTRKGSPARSEVNGNSGDKTSSPDLIAKQALHQRTSSLSSVHKELEDGSLRDRNNSSGTPSSPGPAGNSPEAQLRYENDRLKLALAQSSTNAKKWEVELQTLKNNNARLTTALQESTANVEEWKKQLAAYKEESTRLKKKVLEMEKKQSSSEQNNSQLQTLQQEVKLLNSQTELLQQENAVKQQEIDRLNKRLSDLMTKETLNSTLQTKIQNFDKENQNLNVRVKELERQLSESKTQKQQETQKMAQLHTQLGNKMSEMKTLHEQIVSSLTGDSKS